MDRRKFAAARRQRFGEVLSKYRERHGLSVQQISDLLGKPRSTVLHWMTGRRSPPAKELARMCARLNVNYDLLFTSTVLRDLFYDQQILGFSSLQLRYFEVQHDDALAALSYLSVAGALVFNRLTRDAIECTLQVGHDYLVTLSFHNAQLEHLTLVIQARGAEGLGFMLVTQDNQVAFSWRSLTDSFLDSCVDYLQASI